MLHLVGHEGRGKYKSTTALRNRYRELLDSSEALLPEPVV